MPLTLVPITSATAFSPLMRTLYAAQDDPPVGVLQLFTPVLGTGPKARDDSIQSSTGRLWFSHCCDPGSTWMSVVDDETREVVAGSKWSIVEAVPSATDGSAPTRRPPFDPFWLPEGSALRRYAQLIGAKLGMLSGGRGNRHLCKGVTWFWRGG